MVSVEQLRVSFGSFDLFKDITFLVNQKDRIGLAGRNGAGKSTLLKLLAKEQQPTSGVIVIPDDFTVGYLPQHMLTRDGLTVMDEATSAFDHIKKVEEELANINTQLTERTDYESDEYLKLIESVTEVSDKLSMMDSGNYIADIETTLMGLGFKRSDFTRQTTEFSGGWRMRIELAKILLRKPDLFLLDEPTNHLDIESIQWLEQFLKSYKGAVILVSHDRAFLDNITNRTIEISLGRAFDYKANYTKYQFLRKERREQQIAAYQNQQKMIKDTEQFIERFRYKASKSVQVQSRIKQLDKIDRIEIDLEDNRSLNIKFPPSPRSGTVLVEAKKASKSFGDLKVLDEVDFTLERGEKVAFVGKNGEGKTTFARMIMDEIEYDGSLILGHNLKLGYFAQNQASLLDPTVSIFDTIDKIAVGEMRTKVRDILGAFMFGGEDVDKKVSVLSGGERTRLAMIKLLLEPVNFLILDEPTNHLDIASKDMLKEALKDFDGTLLIISHDREFLDGLVNCVYEFRDKKIKQHLGGIYDFLERRKLDGLRELTTSAHKEDKVVKVKNVVERELSFDERKDINKKIRKLEKTVEDSENLIAQLEEELEQINIKLEKQVDGVADGSLFNEYQEKESRLNSTLTIWEDGLEELEQWKNKLN